MKSEVRKRIEQIRRGEVPDGYKKAKMDIVPTEWKEITISQCTHEYSEKTTLPNQYPVLTSARSGLMLQTNYYSNRQVTTENNIGYNILPYGYVTFRSRSDDGHFRFNENRLIEKGIISYFYPVFCFDKSVSHDFMLQLLNETIYKRIYPYAEGTAQQVLSFKKLGQLKYSIPALPEQQKIADVLTAQDKVIRLKQERLVEKQRQKKYLAQQLLTGKKRLPGFSDKWSRVQLHSIARRVVRKNNVQNGNVLTISAQYGLISQMEFFNKSIASDDKSNYYLLYRDDFAYNKSYSIGYPYGAIKRLTKYDAGIVSPLYICFQIKKEKVSIDFIEQFFEAGLMNHEIRAFAQEGARNHGLLNIATNNFFNANVSLPSIKEQKAIAKIIATADQELELLQKDLELEKQKKKALMQLLLSGIVRV